VGANGLSATTCTPAATASRTSSRRVCGWRRDRHDVDSGVEQGVLGVVDRDARVVLAEFRAAPRVAGDDAGQLEPVGGLNEGGMEIPAADAVADKS